MTLAAAWCMRHAGRWCWVLGLSGNRAHTGSSRESISASWKTQHPCLHYICAMFRCCISATRKTRQTHPDHLQDPPVQSLHALDASILGSGSISIALFSQA